MTTLLQRIRNRWWIVIPVALFIFVGNWMLQAQSEPERTLIESFLKSDKTISSYFGDITSIRRLSAPGTVRSYADGTKEGHFAFHMSGSKKEEDVVVYWKTDTKMKIEKVITDTVFSKPTTIYEPVQH